MVHAVIVAAGSGSRLGAHIPKALVPLAGAPLVAWSVRAFADCDGAVVTAPAGWEADIADALADAPLPVVVVTGGSTRQRSVAAGLAALPDDATRVLVHDAARPLVTREIVAGVAAALDEVDGAIAATRVADTLKRAGADDLVTATVDRTGLWHAETPQGFRAEVIRRVFAAADDAVLDTATDCASMAQAAGVAVRLVASATPNPKVTTPADAVVVAALLRDRI